MGDVIHSARNSIIDSKRSYWLEADALHWREPDGEEGSLPYGDIESLRLIGYASYGGTHFQATLKRKSGGKLKIRSHDYVSLGRFEPHTQSYAALIRALAPKIAAADPKAEFIAGSTGLWLAWTVIAIGCLAIILAFFASLGGSGPSATTAVISLSVLVVAAGFAWREMKKGTARHFDPADPPSELLGGV